MATKIKIKPKAKLARKVKIKPKTINRTFRRGVGTSKLAIPKVNPNPQPPNAPSAPSAPSVPPPTNNNNNNTPQTSPILNTTASTQTPGQTSQTPPNTSPFSSYVPEAGKPDPRDEQYWRDVSRLYFDESNQLNSLNTEDVYAKTAYEQALEERTRQHPRDILASNISANQAGNLLSSVQQENLGQLEQNYFTANTDAERQFQQEQNTRNLTRQALEQGFTLDEAAALAQAIDRQSQNELNRPTPPDPNADTYGDTYGQPGDLDTLLAQILGVGPRKSTTAARKTTTKKTTKKPAAKTPSKKLKIKPTGLSAAPKKRKK